MSKFIDKYYSFLESKIKLADSSGFEISKDDINPICKPHQKDVIQWCIAGGRRGAFLKFSLGKTVINLEIARLIAKHTEMPSLMGLPLGARLEFFKDAHMLGLNVHYVKSHDEMMKLYLKDKRNLFISNYEQIKSSKFNPKEIGYFGGDEFSCIRNLDTVVTNYMMNEFTVIPYRDIFTATPSPNDFTELLNYAHFLGIMDRGQALTRFFQRNSQKAGDLTLYPHKVQEFWLWVSSWAVFITKPSDLGYSDKGYEVPELEVKWHEVILKEREILSDRDGQTKLIRDGSSSLQEAAKEKRESISIRIDKVLELIKQQPDKHCAIWHHLEEERKAIQKAIPEVKSVWGNQKMEEREQYLMDFADGKFQYISTKPEIAGYGSNWQYHCDWEIFAGITYKFEEFIQAIHRVLRIYSASRKITIDIIHTDAERQIKRVILRKWNDYEEQQRQMTSIVKKFGLSSINIKADLKRSMGVKRNEVKTDYYHCINNDNVIELSSWPDDSVHLQVTSIPFSDQYEYCESYHDFGHNDGDVEFFKQMDFTTPQMLRVLKPGRICAVHVKDRIRYSYQNGVGFTSLSDFSGKTVMHFEKHGFHLMGKITVTTDVVQENNQTYRLGWTEQCKDGSKMGVGLPEYVLIFRKPPTDMTNGYADEPVTKKKEDYPVERWQLDAHAYWRSGGNRLLSQDEIMKLTLSQISKGWKEFSTSNIYDFEEHVGICHSLEALKKLPRTFMAVPVVSNSPFVWDDVTRMHTLNSNQAVKGLEKHLCPLQFDIVDRLIERYSSKGEIVLDPFGGLMTVPYRCVKLDRFGVGIELNELSYTDGAQYCSDATKKKDVPTLFDMLKIK